ncbi:hypothetical protein Esi_0189_0042 [Ectocarpus siliculosus]|uniref:Zn(2)-C6 fungal-type domain-containing protein n=1 Tax=Ectocarpus siliculosus TaxID=2880 RepID=D7FPF9_ECTSI|nr:hypothetical protein Esi_0189_0042 [Ectocarpus siliculosus]|eukprot:CBJ30417.1 hypothetical protein Esi_0189_0042 [Ectocarpus siliculosus]
MAAATLYRRSRRDPTIELRKSCDYCVRLKRACDGKNPCSLCARRHKPCTRSARKKSGPAKGTKYAPRRKRSVIAEWADRTSGARGPLLPHEFPGGGTRGGGGQLPHHDFPLAPIDAAGMRAAGRAYYSGGGLSAQAAAAAVAAAAAAGGRFGAEALWEEGGPLPGQGRGRRPGEEGHPSSSLSPSSGLPFPWYAPGPSPHEETEGRGGERGGVGGGRGFAPPPMGYAPTTAEELSRRQQEHGYHHRASYSMSSLEAEAAAAAAAAAAGRRPGVPAAPEPYRRRTLELPPGHWASPSDPFLRSPQQGEAALAQGKRVRLSPPTLGSGAAGGGSGGGGGGGGGRSVMRPGADYYPSPATSPRAREMAGRPHERPRELDPESSLLSLPPPREPPDPTAGFSFHPAANRPSWRRGSTWESGSPGGGGDGRPVDRNDPRAYHQYPPQQLGSFESSDRPPSSSSWSSPGGGGGGGGGGGRGASLGDRRYRNFDREAGEDGQGRGRSVVEWPLPHGGGAGGGGGGDPYHERVELPPPPPHGFDRHLPLERPLMGGGRQGEGRHDMLLGAPSPPRDEQGYAARGADGGAYEHPSGRARWAGGGGDQVGLPGRGSRDHRDYEQEQQRVERGRQDWEGGRRGFWPQGPLRGGVGDGGGGGRGGAAAPFQWERERVEEGRRHHPAGEEGGGVPLPSSSPRAMHTGSSSSSSYQQQEQQQQQHGGEREESPVPGRDGGEEDRKPDVGRHQGDE